MSEDIDDEKEESLTDPVMKKLDTKMFFKVYRKVKDNLVTLIMIIKLVKMMNLLQYLLLYAINNRNDPILALVNKGVEEDSSAYWCLQQKYCSCGNLAQSSNRCQHSQLKW